jgi:thiamine biosynthesis lipoprotein
VRVAGEGPHDGAWHITVENPACESDDLFTRRLHDRAIVTSTTAFRRWRCDGQWVHHIVDPATGRSVDDALLAVVVAADEAWWAEGLAKAALVAGRTDGEELLRRARVDAWFVDENGHIISSIASSTVDTTTREVPA